MPLAIQLTGANIDKIAERVGLMRQVVEDEWREVLAESKDPQAHYYVLNVRYMDSTLPWMIYNHREFLDDFATVPPGIEDHFVIVTQVKSEP